MSKLRGVSNELKGGDSLEWRVGSTERDFCWNWRGYTISWIWENAFFERVFWRETNSI